MIMFGYQMGKKKQCGYNNLKLRSILISKKLFKDQINVSFDDGNENLLKKK